MEKCSKTVAFKRDVNSDHCIVIADVQVCLKAKRKTRHIIPLDREEWTVEEAAHRLKNKTGQMVFRQAIVEAITKALPPV